MIRYGIALGLLVCTAMPSPAGTLHGLAYVVDGDTVVVNGVTVRLKGVDAPERASPGGAEASVALRAIVGNWLRCELTGERTRGREVGYCMNAAGQDIGEVLISTGMALSARALIADGAIGSLRTCKRSSVRSARRIVRNDLGDRGGHFLAPQT
jgi:endonuclease YncB( thermonuclease family)